MFFTQLEKSTKGTNIIHTFVLNNFIQTYHEKASRTYLFVTGLRLWLYARASQHPAFYRNGNFNEMVLCLQRNLNLDTGSLHAIDEKFGSYSPSSHLMDDLYANKIGFIIALNFPQLTLKEKEALGDDRKAWAYARLGDMFTERSDQLGSLRMEPVRQYVIPSWK